MCAAAAAVLRPWILGCRSAGRQCLLRTAQPKNRRKSHVVQQQRARVPWGSGLLILGDMSAEQRAHASVEARRRVPGSSGSSSLRVQRRATLARAGLLARCCWRILLPEALPPPSSRDAHELYGLQPFGPWWACGSSASA